MGRKGRFGFTALLLALAFGVFSSAAMAGPPMVSTGVATNIGGTGASLSASVNPNGLSTTYYFEYGTTTSYGSSTTPVVLGASEGGIKFREANGLTPGVLYHFRVVATNSAGKEVGLDKTFTTAVGWRQLQMTSPTSGKPARFKGVSCPAANTCFAVGEQEPTAGSPSALIERWNGSSWSIQSITGTVSSLDGISCISSTNCTAVGYVKSGTESLPAIVRYNGTTWSTNVVPTLGAPDSALRDVSCTSKGVCVAVGYTGTTSTHTPIAMYWASSSWQVQFVNRPSETAAGELTSISCLAAPYEGFPSIVINKCNAVGWAEKGGARQAAAATWMEGGWTTMAFTPMPSGAKSGQLTGISCPAGSNANACFATGAYVNSEGANAAYTQSWGVGGGWVTPGAGTAGLELSGLSCLGGPGSTVCEAVGNVLKFGAMTPAAQRYAFGSWAVQSPPNPIPIGPGGLKATLVDGGVSCESAGNCMGVGYYEDTSGLKIPVAMLYA